MNQGSNSAFGLILILISSCLVWACGEGSNINSLFIANEDKKNTSKALLRQAEAHYDAAEYADASKYAQKALDLNPSSEEASVLMAYITLSQAGIDSITLASKMISAAATDATGVETSSSSQCDKEEGAVQQLCKLGDVIGLTADDLAALTNPSTDSALGLSEFREPKTAEEARGAGVNVITKVNEAMSYICTFVDESAKVEGDTRHEANDCIQTTGHRSLKGKAHYIWALSHLVEGIAFYTVFNQNLGILQADAESLNSSNTGSADDITAFLSNVNALSAKVDVMLPTGDAAQGSMLTAIFNDLNAVSQGFAAIPGMPEDISKSITEAINELQSKTEKVGQSTGDTGGAATNTAALKDEFTAQMSQEVGNQIDSETVKTFQEDAAKKEEFCTAFSGISSESVNVINGQVVIGTQTEISNNSSAASNSGTKSKKGGSGLVVQELCPASAG